MKSVVSSREGLEMEPRQQAGHGVQDRDPDAAGGREMQMKEKLQMQCNEIQ